MSNLTDKQKQCAVQKALEAQLIGITDDDFSIENITEQRVVVSSVYTLLEDSHLEALRSGYTVRKASEANMDGFHSTVSLTMITDDKNKLTFTVNPL